MVLVNRGLRIRVRRINVLRIEVCESRFGELKFAARGFVELMFVELTGGYFGKAKSPKIIQFLHEQNRIIKTAIGTQKNGKPCSQDLPFSAKILPHHIYPQAKNTSISLHGFDEPRFCRLKFADHGFCESRFGELKLADRGFGKPGFCGSWFCEPGFSGLKLAAHDFGETRVVELKLEDRVW